MKRWHQISGITLGLLICILSAGSALAQGDEDIPPVLGEVLLKLAVIFDGILSLWVDSATGNTLTHPMGERFVNYLAELAQNTVLFFAKFFEVLTFG
jgi:hypothetical protein